jgi:4-amino-4-deoxy-L-arabinose transferase-like glycosyltransferase
MHHRLRPLLLIALLAIVHGLFYVLYQRPDWTVAWTDQGGYRMLAEGLRASGTFTRYPGSPAFVPEAIRTPGYPLFVAAVFLVAGNSHVAVAVAQVILFALLCVMTYRLGDRAGGRSLAFGAGLLTALYAPLPYFAALMLTELWTTFVLVASVLALWRAITGGRAVWFAFAGFLLAYTALSRPVFILLAPFLTGLGAVLLFDSQMWRRQFAGWALLMAAFVLTVSPWFYYNYRHFGTITISPAGGIGRPIWEASWQGQWAGRVQSDLTDLADSTSTDATLDSQVLAFANDKRLDPAPMLTYVHQWRRIRAIWTTPEDPEEKFRARIVGDREYLAVGLENIRHDVGTFLKRRVVRGQFVLWAAEIPVRYTAIDRLPTWVIRAIWLPQLVLCVLAAVGFVALARRGERVALLLLGAPLVYVSAVHFLLLTEARQSLPVKPLLVVLAVAGALVMRPAADRQPLQRSTPSLRQRA